MSSRSMNYLRKNAKIVLVVMGIVCMITFVIGTALTDWVERNRQQASNPNPVVVTWTKGKVHTDQLQSLRYKHDRAYRFLAMVIQTAIQRGGKPMVNGQPVTLDRMQDFDVGIPANNSEEATIQTMVLASEADRMGLVVDQEAVKNFLRQVSAPELREGDWVDIARQVVGEDNRLDVSQLLEHIAYELKAQRVRMLALSGMYAQGVGPIVPPGQAFELFSRLNRRYTIEAYPVETASFVSQVKDEPTERELEELFAEGKNRDPDPNVDEPGFRQPEKIAFKWLQVSFTPFLEEAKKQITEEQIQKAYEQDISQGLHKELELPPETKEAEKSPEEKPAAENPAEAEKSADSSAAADKPAEPAKNDAAKSDAAESNAAKDEPAKPASDDQPKTEDKPAGKAAEPESGCGQSAEEQETQPAEKKEEPASTAAAPATDQDKPAEQPKDAPADPAPANEKAQASEKTPTAEQATPAEQPAATEPAAAKEQKFKPLSEVHDEIQKRLAQPIAEEARKKAVAEITDAIEKYGRAFRRYENVKSFKKGPEVKDPGKLDIVPLATKYGFPIGETPLVDRHEIANYEIGQKVQQFDLAAMQAGQFRMLSFADLAFNQDQPLYRPEEARSSEPDVTYIYFRTAEQKAADVTLKDVREDVVKFWKQRKAYDLALADAKKLADKAKSAGELAAAVPEADQGKIVKPGPFSWMTTGGFGFGQPELSTVPGLELPGWDFMESVFNLKPGETGAAPNQSHQKVYVVRVINQDPDDEKLRAQFLESGYNNMVLMLARMETFRTQNEWYRGLAESYEIKWERPPQDERL